MTDKNDHPIIFVTYNKREGMLTNRDLLRLFGGSPRFYLSLLRQIFEKQITFNYKGLPCPLVEKIQKPETSYFALSEKAGALQAFKDYAFTQGYDLDIQPHRSGMKTATILHGEFGGRLEHFVSLLKHCFEMNLSFEDDGEVFPLVERVDSKSKFIFALHEHPKALRIFQSMAEERNIIMYVPLKTESMLSATDLSHKYSGGYPLFKSLIALCYKHGITYTRNDQEFPVVKHVRAHSAYQLVVDEYPEALEAFKAFSKENGHDMSIQQKREGMRTANDLRTELKLEHKYNYLAALKECYEQKYTIEYNGENHPVVEMVKSNKATCLALSELPGALTFFKKILKNHTIELSYPKKRTGMRTAMDLSKEFLINANTYRRVLEYCFNNEVTFTLRGKTLPLVEKVKVASNVQLALHENPAALKKFLPLVEQYIQEATKVRCAVPARKKERYEETCDDNSSSSYPTPIQKAKSPISKKHSPRQRDC